MDKGTNQVEETIVKDSDIKKESINLNSTRNQEDITLINNSTHSRFTRSCQLYNTMPTKFYKYTQLPINKLKLIADLLE